ncbi:hypothetical protein, partial [Pseudodesulfovibrio pelocollis]|uniref:hypothetical protein n=1 Tax=Pseudodesulfovibrio pelocollis TaxID=3051432 RepID=UPI00255ADBBF
GAPQNEKKDFGLLPEVLFLSLAERVGFKDRTLYTLKSLVLSTCYSYSSVAVGKLYPLRPSS